MLTMNELSTKPDDEASPAAKLRLQAIDAARKTLAMLPPDDAFDAAYDAWRSLRLAIFAFADVPVRSLEKPDFETGRELNEAEKAFLDKVQEIYDGVDRVLDLCSEWRSVIDLRTSLQLVESEG